MEHVRDVPGRLDQRETDRFACPTEGGCGRASCGSATTRPSVDTLAARRRRRSSAGLPTAGPDVRHGRLRAVLLGLDAYVLSCEVSRRTKADHAGPRGLLHPLPLPSRRGGVIGVDWLPGLPVTTGTSTRCGSTTSPGRSAPRPPAQRTRRRTRRGSSSRRPSARGMRFLPRAAGGPRPRVHERAARCSRSSRGASGRASSSARNTTRTATPRQNGSMVRQVIRSAPSPTAKMTTGARGRPGHQQRGLDAGRRAEPVLHRLRPAPASAAFLPRPAGRKRTNGGPRDSDDALEPEVRREVRTRPAAEAVPVRASQLSGAARRAPSRR